MIHDSIHTEELHQILNAGGVISHSNKETSLTYEGYTTRILFQQGRYFLLDTAQAFLLLNRYYQQKGLASIHMDGVVLLNERPRARYTRS